MPPVNDSAANAITLSVPSSVSVSTVGCQTGGAWDNDYANVWYKITPTSDIGIKPVVTYGSGGGTSFVDVYKATTDPPTGWSDLPDWLGSGWDDGASYSGADSVLLTGGETYYIDAYNYEYPTSYEGTFTLDIVEVDIPSNDSVSGATLIGGGETIIDGDCTNATGDNDIWAPNVWYKIYVEGPGELTVKVEGKNGWAPAAMFRTKGAGELVTDVNDFDSGFAYYNETFDGTTSPPLLIYRDDTSPGYIWDYPLGIHPPDGGGIYIYLVVYPATYEDWQHQGPDLGGAFTLTINAPVKKTKCLNAANYINPSSTTASVVGGAVRETYKPSFSWESLPFRGFDHYIGDSPATLVIPGEDITDTPGFFYATVKTKNSTGWKAGGFKRNGQPLWPGFTIDGGGSEITEWVTTPQNSPFPNDLDTLRAIPIKPGDTIEFVIGEGSFYGSGTVDVVQLCFYKRWDAMDGKPYDILDIPDLPMGMSASDMTTNAAQGNLIVGRTSTPTFTSHSIYGFDMCVTDDGKLWAAHNQRNSGSFGGSVTGPVLQYWNGSQWIIVSDNVEGIGVKRTYSSQYYDPYGISIDTDGTDIWLCYQIDDGPWTNPRPGVGGWRNSKIRVKKYDVSSSSFSNVGDAFNAPRPYNGIRSYVGHFEDTPTIRVSPNGIPWVGFVDWVDVDWQLGITYLGRQAYVARWTGSTWDIDKLPHPEGFVDFEGYVPAVYEAETYINGGSGTASVTIKDGRTCVRETQTTYGADTIRFTPPAGKWSFIPLVQWDAGYGTGIKGRYYKNGVKITPFTNDFSTGWDAGYNGPASSFWVLPGRTEFYTECNGSQEIQIKISKYNPTGGAVYIDKILLVPPAFDIQNLGVGPIDVCYVEDNQPHVALYMHRVGETGLGENPGVLYNCAWVKAEITDTNAPDYCPPDVAATNNAWAYHEWVYCEWDGNQWVRKWSNLLENDAPEHVYIRTVIDGLPQTPPVGHFQQGFAFCTDGKDNYMAAGLGGGQPFGFFGDEMVALKIGPNGFVPFTEGPPGGITGPAYPWFDDGDGGYGAAAWGWDITGRSINVDINGNVWLGYNVYWWDTQSAIFHATSNGIGDWFAAALKNETFGWDDIYAATPAVVSNPAGTKLYILWDVYFYGATAGTDPQTFAVWECDIIPDAKIPLIRTRPLNLSRIKFRGYQTSDVSEE